MDSRVLQVDKHEIPTTESVLDTDRVTELNVLNVARNKSSSFKLPVTLWVYGKKSQATALVDSGATTSFINQKFVETNNLVPIKLANPYIVYNADGTENKAGRITHALRAYLEIGTHKHTQYLLVTDLSDKDMYLGYKFLHHHNPEIDWAKGDWQFTRCPESCHVSRKAEKIQALDVEIGINEELVELYDEQPWDTSLDDYGEEDEFQHINWVDLDRPEDRIQVEAVADVLDKDDDDTVDTSQWKSQVPEWVHKFESVFSKTKSERMPTHKPWDHAIEFEEGAKLPPIGKVYPLDQRQRSSFDEWIREERRKGYIEESKSPIAASFFFVKKHDGGLRPCMDYRPLNGITKKNRYPIPRIADLIDALSQASIFTKIDLRWGYNNVRIKEGDEWKTAFVTKDGLFQAKVMYFGFANAPATFKNMMNNIFEDLIRAGKVMVYLDDILIFGNDKKEHRKLVHEVLQRLEDNDLFAKAEKCLFEQDKLAYLGMIISKNHVEMDPAKVTGVTEWPVPTKVKHVQAFLGFANFYRRFIKDFAKITKPLTTLTKKDQPWVWGTEQQKAFDDLKKAFTSAPILRIPDDVNPFRLSTDASDFAIGSVLSQLDPEDNLYHPVAFHSKSLNVHERNYEIYDKEMLAIIRGLEEYRHYLEGHPEKFEIWSDHQNLTYFKQAQKLSRRQARWALYLTRFYFTLHHKPGKTMEAEDPLSRRPDHEEGVEHDNRDHILLKPEFFANLLRVCAIDASHDTPVNDDLLLQEIKKALLTDEVTKNYRTLLESGPREFKKPLEEWNFENGLLLFRGHIYIPKDKDEDLRRRVVQMHHDHPSAGHPGRWKTYELVSRNYWWPGMSVFVKKYVAGCDICQRMKNRTQQPYGPLMPNRVPHGPWEVITIDLITQLLPSRGKNAILVVVCRLTKRGRFFAITNEFSSKDLAKILMDRVYPIHGLPLQIISDRGTQFAAELFQEWCTLLGIESAMSTAYHPQTDGQTERVNQVLEQYLRCFVDNYNHEDWVDYLPTAEFAYNNAAHEGTKDTPYFLEYGRHPRAGPTLIKEAHSADLNEIFRRRKDAQDKAKAALQLAADRMKWYYDLKTQEVPFKVGDKILLNSKDYQTTQRSLTPRYLGPFEIIEQLSKVTFKVKLPPKYRAIHPVFHASKLTPYNTPSIVGQRQPPPEPEEHEGHTEYVVEKIMNHKTTGRVKKRHWYLVRWRGYGVEEDTWEPMENLEGVKESIEEFHRNLGDSPPWELNAQLLDNEDEEPLQIVLEGGKQPLKGSTEAAGHDLYAAEDTVIPIGTQKLISSGIRIKVPTGTYGRIAPRSGLAVKGIHVGAGVIDRDYTGVVKILLLNQSDRDFLVTTGDRIAQLILEKIANANVELVDSLEATDRGTSGFGSTGK